MNVSVQAPNTGPAPFDGRILGNGSALTVPSTIAPGGTASFDVVTSVENVYCRFITDALMKATASWQ